MPKTDVRTLLDALEHYGLENHLSKVHDYNEIRSALENGAILRLEEIKRLLAICEHDMREDMKYTANIISIIPHILVRIREGGYENVVELLPSALAVIHILKTTALLSKVESLKILCYDTLLSYPNDVLIKATEQHEEIFEIFNLYCHMRIPVKMRQQACHVLNRLLKILPSEKKKVFVENGISVWFSKIIPSLMTHLTLSNTDLEMSVETMEMLTDILVMIDFSDNEHWHNILECICSAQKYPAIMKTLLQTGVDIWHRVWIVFIRLLKNQVTQSLFNIGTPINSMLPVVEAAFKMDLGSRCKAFTCWNVLIDSFSTETNESNINKRIKLLIIPLKSNNAKVEITALAKFNCWWHLIQKFQNKIDKFADTVLVSFLNFCFGRHNATDKQTIVPGQISTAMKKLCTQALVDLVGHVNCDGCTVLPQLKGKMINTKNLVDNWNHWIFSLTATIMMFANTENGLTKQQITCLWKSFLMTIGELPENNIRKDLFSEIISILAHLIKECKLNSNLSDIVFNTIIPSLFDDDLRIKQLLKTKNDVNDPLCKIVKILVDPALHLAYKSCSFKETATQLTPIMSTILDPVYSSPTFVIGHLLTVLPATDMGLIVWTSLMDAICQSQYEICKQTSSNLVFWPLKSINAFTDIKIAAITWYTTYDLMHSKLKQSDNFKKLLSQFLLTVHDSTNSTTYFKLCVTLGVIKHKLTEDDCCESEMEALNTLTSHIDTYQNFEQIFPILIDRVLSVMSILVSKVNDIVARNTLFCAKKMLKVMTEACKQPTDVSHILSLVESLTKALESLFQVGSYGKLIPVIVDDVLECSPVLSNYRLTKEPILSLMKLFISKIVENDTAYKKIKRILDDVENNTKDVDKSASKKEFTTPKSKEAPKRTKKKEASIVNTVVENGEEYVVVKSHWKFNPRKLTENQKEKLQRKREDIPALYQDLSQSQDEFKLVTWKTDSQDASNSTSSKSESKSSKTGEKETASEILSNLPSSDVVPKILENFFSENVQKESPSNAKNAITADNKVNKIVPVTPKNTKTPRMALKDRVFRNVRNLIEKSGVQKENKEANEDLNKTELIIKTPTQTKIVDSANVVNSAPPLLSADRPSRVKRKPKKFEELQLLTAKKSRQSLQDVKSKDKTMQNDHETTPLEADTGNTVDTTKEVNSQIIAVPDKKEMTEPNNPQECENTDVVIQSNVELNKDVRTIDNETAKVAPSIEVEHTEKQTASMDLDTNVEASKNEKTNDNKSENANDSKDEDSKINNNVDNKDLNSNNQKSKGTRTEDQGPSEVIDERIETEKVDSNSKSDENNSAKEPATPSTMDVKGVSTPQTSKNKGTEEQKSTTKKNTVRKSRIEKELAIDMVEGHPFLKMQSEKRLTRKALESAGTGRRKSLVEKLNKSKTDANSAAKTDKRTKNRESDSSSSSITVEDSQEKDAEMKNTTFTDDLPNSEDIIESSQDSTITTISVASTKNPKKVPVVALQKIKLLVDKSVAINESQSILDCVIVDAFETSKPNQESKDDIELSLNKTADEDKSQGDLTENMDTEPIDDKELSDVIIIKDDVPAPLTISSDETEVGPDTQELAEADTQPTDPNDFMDVDVPPESNNKTIVVDITADENSNERKESPNKDKMISETPLNPSENATITLSESACVEIEKESAASSPSSFGDEAKRKQDFLNNTLEISPIKNMSPERNKKSPSPETSSDFVVIKLSSPVHSNGEPFEKCGSPEVFTEEKISPDKRDQSPPRVEITVTNTSPSSSLSLKKNRPQVRSGGRAAQMLGLCCVPDKLQTQDKTETEEVKKTTTSSTPARRNLRILYNSVSENVEPTSENEESENFLRFRRSLPAVDSSPSGPILKRKLIDIADDATVSPASKRKRVSFHDPPVSTTVSVQKYIEPGGVRSPQNSAQKRLERQMRQHTPLKSPKRLDHAFKLDTVLNKAIESFTETGVIITPDDTQQFSLDETPVVEIVRASELNDTDPICPQLLDCKDPIDNIAGELSSSAMKSLLVKELEGKVDTVGDLAKMTELEVNRLCIKAPKVKVAKKVLSDYASKRVEKPPCDVMVTIDEAIFDDPMPDPEVKGIDVEMQTDGHVSVEIEVQTDTKPTTVTFVQTETTPTTHIYVQTDESGSTSTADIVKSCLVERPDFVEQIGEQLPQSSIQQITDKLPFSAITDVLMRKITAADAKTLLNRVLEDQWNNMPADNRNNKELSFIREYMSDRLDSKDLIMFCSDLLKSVYDKPARPQI